MRALAQLQHLKERESVNVARNEAKDEEGQVQKREERGMEDGTQREENKRMTMRRLK